MKKLMICAGLLALLGACSVARTAGDAAIGTGQVVLTAADLVI